MAWKGIWIEGGNKPRKGIQEGPILQNKTDKYGCQATSCKRLSPGRKVQLLGRFPVQVSHWFASQSPSVGLLLDMLGLGQRLVGEMSKQCVQKLLWQYLIAEGYLQLICSVCLIWKRAPLSQEDIVIIRVIRQFPYLCTKLLYCDLEKYYTYNRRKGNKLHKLKPII